ncbi:MBL fold metallo-hydrolase [Desulfococcaceae bacterium HSG8]|nr:MBL fold metallo-hydrolase [Desulfococcaceae bacterium HSG8]
MNIIEVAPDLYLIPLDQKLPGFTSFISSWLYKGEKTFLVDVGPASTVPALFEAMENLGVRSLDAILLTHIHIDHAGGVGDVVSLFSDAPVICHSSAISHLEDPSRLWEGSLKTLGDVARAYGPIQPVPPNLIHHAVRPFKLSAEHEIVPFLTPGHAPHHVSYLFDKYLFAGEAGGVFKELPDGNFYLRPATPPRFFLEVTVHSINTLMKIPHDVLCYGHFGTTRRTPQMLKTHKRQLIEWAEVIWGQMQFDEGPNLVAHCTELLLRKDPLLAGWRQMEPAVRERELNFIHNSIRGFIGYHKSVK